jgi:hypothetical protein
VLKYGSHNNNSNIEKMDSIIVDNDMDLDHYLWFTNAIRSSLTRQKYFGRLNSFFDLILIPVGALEEHCKIFVSKCNENPKYSLNCVYRFVIHLKEKIQRSEIVVSTIQLSEVNKTSAKLMTTV